MNPTRRTVAKQDTSGGGGGLSAGTALRATEGVSTSKRLREDTRGASRWEPPGFEAERPLPSPRMRKRIRADTFP